jgi:tRNA-2-methylthio-N6-dimethylallyladenosine synthase
MAGETKVSDRLKNSYPHVDGVFSTHHLWQFPEILYRVLTGNKRQFYIADEAGSIAEGIPQMRDDTLKAWVSIMYGCNNFCTYCIVPYVRGRERSRKKEDILAECRDLIENGCKDITLLGQNVNSYGKDLYSDFDFSDLLAEIAAIPGDFLIRFMTSHPRDAGKKLFDTMASSPKIAKQLHLPFRSGSSRVLKAMNRHYDRQKYLDAVTYAKSVMPDLVLTSDVIVGFPGETEAEFEETISLIEAVRYDSLFTFIFSPRTGTPAASMDDPTSKEEKNRRFDRLCAVQNAISEQIHAAYIGRTLRCLVDGTDKNQLTARTEGGRLVRFAGDSALIGTFQDLTITGATTWSLTGELTR